MFLLYFYFDDVNVFGASNKISSVDKIKSDVISMKPNVILVYINTCVMNEKLEN